jgi:hypothetical protein
MGQLLSRSETTQSVGRPSMTSRGRKLQKCRVAGVGEVYRGYKLPKGRTTGVGSELKLELQKGGYAGSWRRTMIGSDHRLGPIPRKYGRESTPGRAARL